MTLLLLPPSETKRDGGIEGSRLDVAALSFPSLSTPRRAVVRAVRALARDEAAALRVLKLSARAGAREIERDRTLTTSPVMPALERYTGVLYDALDAPTLGSDGRERARDHVLVHSALFGLLGADDPIPAYRLSHDTRLPELPLRAHWATANTAVLAAHDGPVLDLRSEGYAALGPLPGRADARFVRVVSIGPDGTARALNHFNKKGKGEFVRALLMAGPVPDSIDGIIAAAAAVGWSLQPGAGAGRELELVVPDA